MGKADHDIVYIEYDIKAKRIQQAPQKIFLYDHLIARFKDSSFHLTIVTRQFMTCGSVLSPKSSRLLKGIFLQK